MTTYAEHTAELANRVEGAQHQLDESAGYYDATHRLKAIGLAAPPEMRVLSHAVGWPRMYLDSIEERLDVEGFRLAGSSSHIDEMWQWWQHCDLDEESGLAHLEAMIYGRSFVTVAAPDPAAGDEPSMPLIRVESPLAMTAETDPRTRRVTRALRLYVQPDTPDDAKATLYLPDETIPLRRDRTTRGQWQLDGPTVRHQLGVVPVVPLTNRARLADRDGHSEITPEIRAFTDAASRTVMNMQAASELMAIPQRYLFGVEKNEIAGTGTHREVTEAYMARILAFENESGRAGQFTAAELRNFTDALQELAKHVASYTGLPPQYLSFQSDNPASAEAIRSAESRLVKKCERKARMFGGSWEQVMRLAKRVMGQDVEREFDRLETVWRDPSTPTFAAKADAVMKLYANGAGIIPREYARIEMGWSEEVRKDMAKMDDAEPVARLNALVGGLADPNAQRPPQNEPEAEAA